MVSSVILKKKKIEQLIMFSIITIDDVIQLIDFSDFVKAYAKLAILIHNSCVNGSKKSEYQAKLASEKNHAKNQLRIAKANLEECNTPLFQQSVSEWTIKLATLSEQIQTDIKRAKQQYLLIRQSNWIFAAIFELVKTDSSIAQQAILGHSLDDKGHPILIIQIADRQISCPIGFTNLSLDKDGFQQVLEHTPVYGQLVEEDQIKATPITELTQLRIELKVIIKSAKEKYIKYDVK
jgi:hypothetical protein